MDIVPLAKRFVRDFLPILSFRAGSILLAFVISVFLARNLGASQYGGYVFAIALLTVLQPLAGGGLTTLSIRNLSNPNLAKNEKEEFASHAILCVIAISVVVGSAASLSIYIFSPEKILTAGLAFILLPCFILVELFRGILVGQKLIRRGQYLSEIWQPAVFLSVIIYLLYFQSNFASASTVLICFALVKLLVVFLMLRSSRLQIPIFAYLSSFRGKFFKIIRQSYPFAMVTAAQYINTKFDILSLGYLLSDTSAGQYQIYSKMTSFIGLPSALLALLILPRISESYQSGNFKRLISLFWKAQLAGILMALPLAVLFFIYGEFLIGYVFGLEYLLDIYVLYILILVQLFFCGTNILVAVKSMVGREKTLLYTFGVSATVNVILNILLIPLFGVFGAASATAFTGAATFGFLAAALNRRKFPSNREV